MTFLFSPNEQVKKFNEALGALTPCGDCDAQDGSALVHVQGVLQTAGLSGAAGKPAPFSGGEGGRAGI